ncbi:putative transmembrane protein [Toxoplasma gondii GAB2-2007-GAL-DOM2]|uniref:Putative transmembrane protein n=3 Tax=Toxoplasma gondii TaxID=5811 RepID=A0A2T6J241_TOXGO|nr:putative transmembrane protein [Toxoplasma gondii GAB2-2007-GAL-DOM2]KFG50176.1 putative transmembrane protein [Toxoplasma gondii p89]PUA91662.1 putative transmembrane protein [Toxoplasma gondii TgCATBr9]
MTLVTHQWWSFRFDVACDIVLLFGLLTYPISMFQFPLQRLGRSPLPTHAECVSLLPRSDGLVSVVSLANTTGVTVCVLSAGNQKYAKHTFWSPAPKQRISRDEVYLRNAHFARVPTIATLFRWDTTPDSENVMQLRSGIWRQSEKRFEVSQQTENSLWWLFYSLFSATASRGQHPLQSLTVCLESLLFFLPQTSFG